LVINNINSAFWNTEKPNSLKHSFQIFYIKHKHNKLTVSLRLLFNLRYIYNDFKENFRRYFTKFNIVGRN